MDTKPVRSLFGELYRAWREALEWIRRLVIVFFIAFLAAGLLLRLPWKILLLPAVVPAVGIFVPRKAQKWIWLSLTAVVIGVFVWIHLPEEDGSQWRTYRFDTESDPFFPTGPENAAVQYIRIIEEYGDMVFSYPYSETEDQVTYGGPWDPIAYPGLSDWLEGRSEALAELVRISQMPFCRFPASNNFKSYNIHTLRLKMMKAWAAVLIRSAHRDLHRGRTDAALDQQLAILGMSRHLYQQGTLLDQAGGFYLEQIAHRNLREFAVLEKAREDQLARIAVFGEQVVSNWPENWPRILAVEKLRAKNAAGMFYQVNEAGRTRISRDLGQGLNEALGHPAYRFLRSKELSRLLAGILWVSIPSTPERVGQMIDERFDRYSRMVESGRDIEYVDTRPIWMRGLNSRSLTDWIAKQQVSYYYPLADQAQRHEALGRVLRIVIELKRYRIREGQWPGRLNELLGGNFTAGRLFDPVSELPFVYERTGESFRLYSIGVNKRDDGGLHNIRERKDDKLYWPTMEWEPALEEETKNGDKDR